MPISAVDKIIPEIFNRKLAVAEIDFADVSNVSRKDQTTIPNAHMNRRNGSFPIPPAQQSTDCIIGQTGKLGRVGANAGHIKDAGLFNIEECQHGVLLYAVKMVHARPVHGVYSLSWSM